MQIIFMWHQPIIFYSLHNKTRSNSTITYSSNSVPRLESLRILEISHNILIHFNNIEVIINSLIQTLVQICLTWIINLLLPVVGLTGLCCYWRLLHIYLLRVHWGVVYDRIPMPGMVYNYPLENHNNWAITCNNCTPLLKTPMGPKQKLPIFTDN